MPLSRARIFHLTRSLPFLWKSCTAILVGSILLGAVMLALEPRETKASLRDPLPTWEQQAKNEYEALSHGGKKPERLADFFRVLAEGDEDEPMSWKFDGTALKLGPLDLGALLIRHLTDEGPREVLADFMRHRLHENPDERNAARHRLHEAASQAQAPRFAAEFEGDLCVSEGRHRDALEAYRREGLRAEAVYAKKRAFEIALAIADTTALREMCADARWRVVVGSSTLYQAAKLVHDPLLLWNSLMHLQLQRWVEPVSVTLALFAAVVWYLILVHASRPARWRWLRPLTAVLAGIMSVWLLHWMQGMFQFEIAKTDNPAAGQEIIHWIIDVGVPEELVKLLAFALFVPLLARRGSLHDAALIAGCTGLGFALNENLGYFQQDFHSHRGGTVAIERLVTANFLHIALTGIVGVWFCEMVRSRFHRVTEFLVAFAGVAAAHGIYDYATTAAAMESGVQIAGILILGIGAKMYFEKLRPPDVELSRHVVSCTSMFCIGGTILTGMVIVATIGDLHSLRGATAALRAVVSIFPIVILYVREFREV